MTHFFSFRAPREKNESFRPKKIESLAELKFVAIFRSK